LARARQALNVRQVRLGLPRPRRLAAGPFSAPGCRGCSAGASAPRPRRWHPPPAESSSPQAP